MDKSKSHHLDKKGNSSEGSRVRNPQSPGKRRMVESRLIARGGTDSDDEVEIIRTQVNQPVIASTRISTSRPTEQPILDTTGSRKRKTLFNPTTNPTANTPVVILPSPTTQIARRIDSINLETLRSVTPHQRTPAGGGESNVQNIYETTSKRLISPSISSTSSSSVHQKVIEERMDLGPASATSMMDSPYNSKKNVIVESIKGKEDEVVMERYLQRPEEAANMKRPMTEKGSEENKRKSKGSSKVPKTGPGYQSSEVPSSVRVPTIHQSSHSRKNPYPLPVTTAVTTPIMAPTSSLLSGQPTLTPFPLLPFSSLPLLPSIVPPVTSTSPQHQSKTKSFSINDLLAKEPTTTTTQQSTPPLPQSYSYINPSLLLFYQQWITQQLAAAAVLNQSVTSARFQGEPAETDTCNSSPITVGTPSSQEISVGSVSVNKSPMRSSSSSGSPRPPSSPVITITTTATNNNTEHNGMTSTTGNINTLSLSRERSEIETREEGENRGEGEKIDGRQNALLQVSEAHLAILPDEDGDTPLHLAIIQENIPLTFYLVRLITGVSMNLDIANNLRQTPLHLAVITGQSMLVNLLVQAGASIDHPDRRGNTCIHLAAQRKNVNILQILSRAENCSPNYNARNFAGLTPVHIATREGSIDVLKFLFQVGANKNMADSCSGRTALHYAVEAQNFQVCNFLLENSVNVNLTTFSGNTPLHVAAGRRLKEIVALLMAYGANPAIANGEGDFPSDLPASLLMQRAKMGNR